MKEAAIDMVMEDNGSEINFSSNRILAVPISNSIRQTLAAGEGLGQVIISSKMAEEEAGVFSSIMAEGEAGVGAFSSSKIGLRLANSIKGGVDRLYLMIDISSSRDSGAVAVEVEAQEISIREVGLLHHGEVHLVVLVVRLQTIWVGRLSNSMAIGTIGNVLGVSLAVIRGVIHDVAVGDWYL